MADPDKIPDRQPTLDARAAPTANDAFSRPEDVRAAPTANDALSRPEDVRAAPAANDAIPCQDDVRAVPLANDAPSIKPTPDACTDNVSNVPIVNSNVRAVPSANDVHTIPLTSVTKDGRKVINAPVGGRLQIVYGITLPLPRDNVQDVIRLPFRYEDISQ